MKIKTKTLIILGILICALGFCLAGYGYYQNNKSLKANISKNEDDELTEGQIKNPEIIISILGIYTIIEDKNTIDEERSWAIDIPLGQEKQKYTCYTDFKFYLDGNALSKKQENITMLQTYPCFLYQDNWYTIDPFFNTSLDTTDGEWLTKNIFIVQSNLTAKIMAEKTYKFLFEQNEEFKKIEMGRFQ